MPLLRCVTLSEVNYIMREIYEGICGNNIRGKSLALKALRQGWPTIKSDNTEFAKKCDEYQQLAPISKAHPEKLTMITSPWPFTVWGIDLIGQLPKGKRGVQYVVVLWTTLQNELKLKH